MLSNDQHHRSELATFLKMRRRRLQPADYGVVSMTRRRTPGLRREEVAELAQVGPTWYTWLEQGRDIRASAGVIQKIAAVLQLNEAETRHVLELSGHSVEEPVDRAAPHDATLKDVVDTFICPAFVRNDRYDVLTWNDVCADVFDFDHNGPSIERNFLWRLFRQSWRHVELPDWRDLARQLTADLRIGYARYGNSDAFHMLVADLGAASSLFAEWWSQYPVDELKAVPQRIRHASLGELHVKIMHFAVVGFSDLKLVLAAPEREAETKKAGPT
jgi:transcriptional regulator with XRE-family HTH domain